MQKPLIADLANRDPDRKKGYSDYLDFYNGIQWTRRTRREKQLTFNYAKVFIDKITSYLMSESVFAVDPLTDSEADFQAAEAAEKAINQVVVDNNLEELDFATEIDAAILGDGCYKVTWDTLNKRVRITAPDVQGVYAWWQPDDPAVVYQVASRYKAGDNWISEVWTDKKVELYTNDQLTLARKNPYGFIPYIIFPNLRQPKQFWGLSDIPDISETQRELNRALTQVSTILELSGNPITVLENIESAEDIAVQPGAVWELPEKAKAYLLDLLQGGGVKLHIEYIELLYRILHDTSESPKAAYGRTDRDLSGIALEIELQPLLQKVRRKRLIRTTVYRRRSLMILRLLRTFTGVDLTRVEPRMTWGTVLPQDRARIVGNETALVQAGIHSRRRAMDELGVESPEAELKIWLEERESILKQNQNYSVKVKGTSESAATNPSA
jgi:hypothetical protein